MRIRLLRSVIRQGREHPTGAVLDVSDGLGQSLVEGGVAAQVRALTSPPNTQARLSAPHTKSKERKPS